ncbi:MAG: hypothetical protein ABFD75_06375 [Smithella sp.]
MDKTFVFSAPTGDCVAMKGAACIFRMMSPASGGHEKVIFSIVTQSPGKGVWVREVGLFSWHQAKGLDNPQLMIILSPQQLFIFTIPE